MRALERPLLVRRGRSRGETGHAEPLERPLRHPVAKPLPSRHSRRARPGAPGPARERLGPGPGRHGRASGPPAAGSLRPRAHARARTHRAASRRPRHRLLPARRRLGPGPSPRSTRGPVPLRRPPTPLHRAPLARAKRPHPLAPAPPLRRQDPRGLHAEDRDRIPEGLERLCARSTDGSPDRTGPLMHRGHARPQPECEQTPAGRDPLGAPSPRRPDLSPNA